MGSAALSKLTTSIVGAEVLIGYAGSPSVISSNQKFADACLLSAAIAQAVGCWEGYLEGVIREFVSKTRVQAHRKAWTLIVQFESLVDKMASELNTPNWDRSRELLLSVTGMDPFVSWIWSPKFTNQTDTKNFFDGILKVRHSFAHGFSIPTDIPGPAAAGVLDPLYVREAVACLRFFAETTDRILEYELTSRHGCTAGWS